jgi:hypothetical protein
VIHCEPQNKTLNNKIRAKNVRNRLNLILIIYAIEASVCVHWSKNKSLANRANRAENNQAINSNEIFPI